MEQQDIYSKIKNEWTLHGYSDLITEMENFTRGAATGTEGTSMLRFFFKKLKKEKHDAFKLTEDLIIAFFKDCEKYGFKNDL